MEALRQERVITPNLESSIGLNGVREMDEFVLEIFQERKKSFKLNRTRYKIQTAAKFEYDFSKTEIKLPCFGKEEGAFELLLVTTQFSNQHNDKSRYLFRSTGKSPFRLNGIYCFEAFLERGDIIDIGFNRVHFPRVDSGVAPSHPLSSKLIQSHISVLIEGETGTGKTTLAKQIHEASQRQGRFVHLNLSAFSPGLIESELFGHVKGAFTGAVNSKRGAILEAHKGTLFLDEIDSLTLDLQTKLLLFLDNYEVRAVGGESVSKAEVRMIFASGTKLTKRINDGLMRKDFYYRLQAGCSVGLESLRERPERILELCHSFESREAVVIDRALSAFYSSCKWPGNIRQLQSHLIKKKILCEGKKIVFDEVDKELILDKVEAKSDRIQPLEKIKLSYCHEVFLRMDKNITKTAKVLELCPNTLKNYLSKREEELRNHNVINVDF